jgi:hypothetical protein
MGLCQFFHETWQFFKDLELTVIEYSDFFQIPRLFDSEHFQIPETGGSLVLNFFKIPETGRYYKDQILAPTLV